MNRDIHSIIFMYVLGGLIVLMFFAILYLLVFNKVPESNREVLNIMLGALVGSFSSVVGYYYGSSKGSKDKTDMMNNNQKP